ncbi:MAG TPA: hypothetical protein VI756_07500 [Blastocatellia bacterium]
MTSKGLFCGLIPPAVPLLFALFTAQVAAHPCDEPSGVTSKVEHSPINSPLPGARSLDPAESGGSYSFKVLSPAYGDLRFDHMFSGISDTGNASNDAAPLESPLFGEPRTDARWASGPITGNQANLHQGPNPSDGKMERLAGPPASTAPMAPGEKFHFYLTKTFKPPDPYVLSILDGLFKESFNLGNERVGSYFVNSMADAGRNFAFRVTSNFFSHFAYATMFKQDPRFHRLNEGTTGTKIKRAIFRVFITQDDHNERDEVNYSFLLGNLSAAAISNVWEPKGQIGVGPTLARWATSLGTKALRDLFDQYVGR